MAAVHAVTFYDMYEFIGLIVSSNVKQLAIRDEDKNKDYLCPICQGDIGKETELIAELPCGTKVHHYMHKECLGDLCRYEGPIFCCPICRQGYILKSDYSK